MNKSNQILHSKEGPLRLRRWQENFLRRHAALKQLSFLLTAAPGAGKSFAAALAIKRLLSDGKAERIVVVVPTENLKEQWAQVFSDLGIELDPHWSNSSNVEASIFKGVIVTYSQVSAEPELHDFNCLRKDTVVIFDEIHHAADGLDWGNKLRLAFTNAVHILCLSGTPFRHDSYSIPFVRYDRSGRSIADFTYSYAQAIADEVCRPIFFPSFEGEATWQDGQGNYRSEAEFAKLPKDRASGLLRAVLDPAGNWMQTVLKEANDRLSEIRLNGHSDAGGLVIAMDQAHARKIGKVLKRISGEEPVIVISDDPDAAISLHEFSRAGSSKLWVIAVRMVSEGIDIPRLRVGVYATNILSELFFRQAVGRFVRIIGGLGYQSAALYIPAHSALVKHAMAIKDERKHVLPFATLQSRTSLPLGALFQESSNNIPAISGGSINATAQSEEIMNREGGSNSVPPANGGYLPPPPSENMGLPGSNNSDRPPISRQTIITIKTEATYQETIFNGQSFSDEELKQAEGYAKHCGLNAPIDQLAAFARAARAASVNIAYGDANAGNASSPGPADKISTRTVSASPAEVISSPDGTNADVYSALFPESSEPVYKRRARLRALVNKTTNSVAHRRNVKPGVIHGIWTHTLKQPSNDRASLEDLVRKLNWLNSDLMDFTGQ